MKYKIICDDWNLVFKYVPAFYSETYGRWLSWDRGGGITTITWAKHYATKSAAIRELEYQKAYGDLQD